MGLNMKFLILFLLFYPISYTLAETTFEGDIEADWDHVTTSDKPNEVVYTFSHKLGGNGTFALLSETTKDDFFAKAKLQTKLNFDGTVAPEDVFMIFGKTDTWDITIGHFEALELFAEGESVVFSVAESGNINKVNDVRGRAAGAVMPRIYFGDLSFQINMLTKEAEHAGEPTNYKGLRPAIEYTSGPLSVALGVESVEEKAQKRGVDYYHHLQNLGVKIKFDKEQYFVGLSLGSRHVTGDVDETHDNSVGLIAFYKGLGPGNLGFGGFSNNHENKSEKKKITTQVQYLSYAMPLLTDKSSLKIGLNNSKADEKTTQNVRLRFTYTL